MKFKKCIGIVFIILFYSTVCFSQKEISGFEKYRKDQRQKFEQFRDTKQQELDDYITERNKEFANFLKERWELFEEYKGIMPPDFPKPVYPVKKDEHREPSSLEYPVLKVEPILIPVEPVDPYIPPVKIPVTEVFEFPFYSYACKVRLDKKERFVLSDITEKSVGNCWELLSQGNWNTVVADCLQLRNEWSLADWGYVMLIKSLVVTFMGEKNLNEQAFLQGYLLSQSGFDVKIVRKGNRLLYALASGQLLYNTSYILSGGRTYFLMDAPVTDEKIYTYKQSLGDDLQPCNLFITREQHLPFVPVTRNVEIPVVVNQVQIDLYNDYPICDWIVYANAPMGKELWKSLYQPLKKKIEGYSKSAAAAVLLNYVQTAFEYMTDEEQFGYERPFFPDETFYYPYSDCEDRAILYAYLVKKLLGNEVVFLHYPNHLANAVYFEEDLPGDYVRVDGKKYLICDPTYVGASIGVAMSNFKNIQANVLKIY